MIPIVIGAFGTILKRLVKGLEDLKIRGQVETIQTTGRCPRGVMVKVMDCGIVVSEFVLQSRYYVHFKKKKEWFK